MKVIYYFTRSGRKPVFEFIEEQGEKEQAKIYRNISMLREQGYMLHRPYAAKITEKIHELRVEAVQDNFRILYYFNFGERVVLLHAFKKKTQKLNRVDIETAENRMKDFIERIEKGEVII